MNTENHPKISEAIDEFIHDLDGVKNAEEIACPLIQLVSKRSQKDYNDLVKEFKQESGEESGDISFSVPVERHREFKKAQRKHALSRSAIYQTPRALLVAMVSSFDAYLARLLRCVFYLLPKKIDTSDRVLKFSQLVKLESLETAREYIIEKEIDTFLRKSHIEHFDSLENLLGMKLREGLSSWPRFVEITQRRNLFVHCDGIVSQQYLDICSSNNVDLEGVNAGDRLYLDDEYFRDAFECLYEIGVKLAHVVWRKLLPDEREKADDSLNQVCYELLMIKRYRLSHNLLRFSTEGIGKHSTTLNRRMFIINRAIAAKFGEIESDPSALDSEDWSDCGLQFHLALAVLQDDYDKACELMRQIGADHKTVNRWAYGNWPLFTEFRETEIFQETYKNLFGKDFNVTAQSGDAGELME